VHLLIEAVKTKKG